MPSNIIVGYDDLHSSRSALQQAVSIASAAQAWVHLVHVDEDHRDADIMPEALETPGAVAVHMADADLVEDMREPLDVGGAFDYAIEACQDADVPFTCRRVHGTVGERLPELAMPYDLLVVGQSSRPRVETGHRIGANMKHILRTCPIPMLVGAYNYIPLDSAAVLYQSEPAGGRAVAFAGALCAALNIPLKVVLCGDEAALLEQVRAELRYVMKGFHVEYDVVSTPGSMVDTVPMVPTEWGARCVIMPFPSNLWPWSPNPVKTALATQNLLKIFIP